MPLPLTGRNKTDSNWLMNNFNSVFHRLTVIFSFLIVSLWPQIAAADGIDAMIDKAVQPLTDALSSFIFFSVKIGDADVPLIVCWLIFAACFFTLYLGFINLRGFKHAIDIVRVVNLLTPITKVKFLTSKL